MAALAFIDELTTIEPVGPSGFCFIARMACCTVSIAPVWFTPITLFQPSMEIFSTLESPCSVPALAKAMSSRPCLARMRSISAGQPSASSTLCFSKLAPVCSHTAFAAASFEPVNTTCAPSAASRATVPAPIPDVPPVTSATFPSSRFATALSQIACRFGVDDNQWLATYAFGKVTPRWRAGTTPPNGIIPG